MTTPQPSGALQGAPTPVDAPLYPEHEKLSAVREQSQTIGDFLDWLREEQGISLRQWMEPTEEVEALRWNEKPNDPPRFYTVKRPGYYSPEKKTEDLLAEFFGIDLKALEAEKRALLESIRNHRPKLEPCPS